MHDRETLIVAAAAIIEHGRVLVTQRKPDAHLAGMWEFPGGKVLPDEDPRDALMRELREELGVEVFVRDVVDVSFHRFDDRSVLLIVFAAARTTMSPAPRALDVAAFRWAAAAELDETEFPEPDRPALTKIRSLLRAHSRP